MLEVDVTQATVYDHGLNAPIFKFIIFFNNNWLIDFCWILGIGFLVFTIAFGNHYSQAESPDIELGGVPASVVGKYQQTFTSGCESTLEVYGLNSEVSNLIQ